MREIILDTETTGLSTMQGDRLIEVGCIELFNRIPTGREYHAYVNPERAVPAEAVAVHGITTEQLRDKPLFRDLAGSFLEFIGDDPLVIHNATFDIGFLNFELELAGLTPLLFDRVVDTLSLARRKHPAGPNSLDGLCKRYGIEAKQRIKHGAIIDSLLLAEVYVELLGERQAALSLQSFSVNSGAGAFGAGRRQRAAPRAQPLAPRLSNEDVAAHQSFIAQLGAKALWLKFWTRAAAE